MADNFKKLLVEKKGVTVEKEPETLKADITNSSVYTPETHKQTEEVRYVLVEDIGKEKFDSWVKRYPKDQQAVAGEIANNDARPEVNHELLRDVRGSVRGKGGKDAKNIYNESEEAKELPDFSGMSYPQKFEALMKHHGIEKISELSDEEKKEFFNTLDDIHVSKDEKAGDVEPSDIKVGEDSVSVEIPGSEINSEIGEKEMEELKEAIRAIHVVLSGKPLNEGETVEVPADAEAEVKIEGDKVVVEIPVESPKEEVSEEEAEVIEEAVSAISRVLRVRG